MATIVPPPEEPRYLRLENELSSLSGTLINLTKLPMDLASNILGQLNESRIPQDLNLLILTLRM